MHDYHVLIEGMYTEGTVVYEQGFDYSWSDEFNNDETVVDVYLSSWFQNNSTFIFPKYTPDGEEITEISTYCKETSPYYFHGFEFVYAGIDTIYIPSGINKISKHYNYGNGMIGRYNEIKNIYFEGSEEQQEHLLNYIYKAPDCQIYYNAKYPLSYGVGKMCFGNKNNIAKSIKQIYIGNQNGKAQLVNGIYIGNQNNIANKLVSLSGEEYEKGLWHEADVLIHTNNNQVCLRLRNGDPGEKLYTYTDITTLIKSIKLKEYLFEDENQSFSEIANYGFANCYNLQTLYLPKSITKIEHHAFANCNSNVKIYYEGTQEDWNQINIDPTGNDVLFNNSIIYNYPIR